MTDLNTKFDGLRTQLAQQHDDTTNALNALLTALGAPPPSPGATLADVVGALNQIAVQLSGLRLDMATQHNNQLLELKTITTTLDIINANNSYNAQQFLLAIAANDPCKPCEVPSYELPPLIVSPVTVDQEHCRRVQALLYAITRFAIKLDLISSLGAGFNTNIISSAFDEILTELNTAQNATISLPSFNELLQIVAACVQYIASNILGGYSLQSSFVSIKNDLIQPLYDANTADAGRSVYRSFIDATTLPNAVKAVLKSIGYISLFNLYYSDEVINTTGFDGTICAPAAVFPPADGCIVLDSSLVIVSDNQTTNAIVWPDGGSSTIPAELRPAGAGSVSANAPIWLVPSLAGYWIWTVTGNDVGAYPKPDGSGFFLITGNAQQLTTTSYLALVSGSPFSVQICKDMPE